MNITSGKISTPIKAVLYGPEGIGKSTFASQFPDPVFIDTEGSTKHMDVRRFDKPTSWAMLLQQVAYAAGNDVCKTLVIDTADWAEMLCAQDVCAKAHKNSIEDFGYGKGYTFLQEEFGRLLNALEEVIAGGKYVLLTAHAKMRKFEQPDEMGAYDRWEMKLTKQVAPMVKEWADMVLFANYKTIVVRDDTGKGKAQGGKRVMYTTHHPCWDAKNRHGLPDELPFEFAQIAHLFSNMQPQKPVEPYPADLIIPDRPAQTPAQPTSPSPAVTAAIAAAVDDTPPEPPQTPSAPLAIPDGIPKALADLMAANNVTEQEIQQAVASKGYFPIDTPIRNYNADFVSGCLIGAWNQVFAIIQEMRELPFN